MKNLINTGWDNFRKLMAIYAFEIIKGMIYASFGVAFVAFIQGVEPTTLVTGNEFIFAQLVLGVSLVMAVLELVIELWHIEPEPEKDLEAEPTPAPPEAAQTEA